MLWFGEAGWRALRAFSFGDKKQKRIRLMYAKQLSAYEFRCFGKAVMELQYPGRRGKGTSEIPNVNLILGDNGGGKSSVLRAIAIAVLAPVLLESGFVAYRMVRRPKGKNSLVKVNGRLSGDEYNAIASGKKKPADLEMLARFEARENQSRDRLHLDSTPNSPIANLIYDDKSPAFFLVGYGATRRVETGDFSESSARRLRGLRYQRVAGLFEDHVAVRPLQVWFQKLDKRFRTQACDLLNAVLPPNVRFDGEFDADDEQYLFNFNGLPTPFSSLSDGYKAFVGMAGDLIGHLADVCPPDLRLDAISGIVLIDEIDLHLHPEWQRTILPSLAKAFPKLQFVCTTHSPLVASTVRSENVFVTAEADNGTATIKQIDERVFGQSAEQLLLSSYFGLQTTRSPDAMNEADTLLANAASGNKQAAVDFLAKLAAPAVRLNKEAKAPAPKRKRGTSA
jgi:hypothetical protein